MKPLPPDTYPQAVAVLEFAPGELVTLEHAGGGFEDISAIARVHVIYYLTTGGNALSLTTGGKLYVPGAIASVGLAVPPATREAPAFLGVEPDYHLRIVEL